MTCTLYLSLPASLAFSADLKLGWFPNEESNLQGYRVHYGTKPRNYPITIDIGNPSLIKGLVTFTISNLTPYTTYYFSLTSYNDEGLSSDLCPELTWTYKFHHDNDVNDDDDIFINPTYYNITLNCFPTIKEGYLAADEYSDIYISADDYFEDLIFNQPKQVYLSAGWKDDFHENTPDTTTIYGSLTITKGTIILDNLIITNPNPNFDIAFKLKPER